MGLCADGGGCRRKGRRRGQQKRKGIRKMCHGWGEEAESPNGPMGPNRAANLIERKEREGRERRTMG
jgi:hypothetical protein